MEKWYSREFISSTQTASRLVFNVGNCVDQSRILPSTPSRPPDALGKECYVYVMRGSAVTSIKELPVDELAPWNSKSCKSSTRFSEVSYDPQSGQIVMRRHAISDTSVVPGNLFACYYCRHPIFCLSKKIYYACYGNREACLPDTFVLFVYEFDGPEKLYARGYINAPSFSSSSHQLSNSHHTAALGRQRRSMEQRNSMQWETLYGNSTAGGGGGAVGDEGTASSSLSLLDQFLQSGANGANGEQQPCSLKFAEYLNETVEAAEEDGRDNPTTTTETSLIDMMLKSLSESTATADGCGGEVGEGLMTAEYSTQPGLRFPNQMDLTGHGMGTGTGRALALHSTLQTSSPYHPNNFKRLHRRQQRSNFPPPPPPSKDFNKRKLQMATHATVDLEAKRKALGSSFGQPRLSIGPCTTTPSLPSNYRHIHISPAALENFKCNGLCAEDELVVVHDTFAELLNSSAATSPPCRLHEMTEQMHLGRHGGCLVAGLPLEVECAATEGARRKLRFTCLWFRNNALLTAEGLPVLHPLAILVKSADNSNVQCHESLGHEYSCLLSELESKLIPTLSSSRAIFASEAVQLDVSKFPHLLRYPCVSLHCLDDFKRMLRERLSDVEGEVGRMVEEDIVGKVNVEDLSQSTGLLNSLRLEEFVRKLTLVERKWPVTLRMWFREKSGWIFERLSLASRLKSGFAPLESATMAAQFEPLRDQLSKHLRQLTTSSSELSAERITLLLDEFTNDVLSRSAQSLFDAPSAPSQTTEELRLNPSLAHLRVSRDAWSRMERAERTAKLREIGLGALPEEELLLTASDSAALMLNSIHLGERSRRDKLALLSAASRLEVVSLASGEFATVDSDRRLRTFSHFVGHDFYCQCNRKHSSAGWKLCEHLCAVGLARPGFAQALSEWRNEETCTNSSRTCSPATCAETLVGEVRSEQDDEIEHKAARINFARRSTLVDMIHCSGNAFHDEGNLPEGWCDAL